MRGVDHWIKQGNVARDTFCHCPFTRKNPATFDRPLQDVSSILTDGIHPTSAHSSRNSPICRSINATLPHVTGSMDCRGSTWIFTGYIGAETTHVPVVL